MANNRKPCLLGTLLIFSVLLLFSVFGCASSSGSLFEDMAEKDNSAEKEEEKEAPAEPGILIETEPEGAELYINGIYEGTTPLTIRGLASGEYSLEIRKIGYKREKIWVRYNESEYEEYFIEMTEVTGFLSVDFRPEESEILIDGRELESNFEELQIGTYNLTVRAFGYKPFRESISIEEDETTIVAGVLREADLEIEELRVSKSVFNPENPGSLGTATLRFRVTKPGIARVSVFSPEAEQITQPKELILETWNQSYTWDGKDREGKPVADGSCTFFIEAFDEERTVTEKIEVIVDSSRRISYASTLNGSSGLMYSPDADILPEWASQLGISFLGHIQTIEGVRYYRFPIQASLRLSPLTNLELCAAGGIKLTSAAETPLSVSVSGKYQFLNLNLFRMAASAKGGFVTNDTEDTLTNYSGFSAGLPMQLVFGPVHILASPEFIISPVRVAYFADETFPEQTVYIWNYFRSGIALRWKRIGFGVSAAFRMLPYSEGFGLHWPLPAGGEFYFIIPNTQVVLILQGGGEFSINRGYYLFLGLGAALLN